MGVSVSVLSVHFISEAFAAEGDKESEEISGSALP
jgi:hypothetical protein